MFHFVPLCTIKSITFYRIVSSSPKKSCPGVPRVGKLHAGSPDISCERYNRGGQQIFLGGQIIFLNLVGQIQSAKIDHCDSIEKEMAVHRFLIVKQNHPIKGREGPKVNRGRNPLKEQVCCFPCENFHLLNPGLRRE